MDAHDEREKRSNAEEETQGKTLLTSTQVDPISLRLFCCAFNNEMTLYNYGVMVTGLNNNSEDELSEEDSMVLINKSVSSK